MENNRFKLIYTPGLEDLGLMELKEKWPLLFEAPLPEINRAKGVLSFETSYEIGVSLNYWLKIPSKIHLIIAEFKCRDLPKLFNKIKKIDWKPYLYREEIDFEISSKKSRLINTKKIEETALDSFKNYFNANHLKTSIVESHKDLPNPKIFLRLVDDELTIHLNTSGELLHKRGENEYRGLASLRESYASALVYLLKSKTSATKLIDPMCGSGSFLNEANLFYSPTLRDFGFKEAIHLKPKKELDKKLFHEFYARDVYKKNIEYLSEAHPEFHPEVDNLFKANKTIKNEAIIINAPYGKRVKLNDTPENYYPKLANAVIEAYKPQNFGMLIPRPSKKTFLKLKDLNFKEVLRFSNNSIDVSFFLYQN